jgi:hypothetical protein
LECLRERENASVQHEPSVRLLEADMRLPMKC